MFSVLVRTISEKNHIGAREREAQAHHYTG
jgi:hypothetical protein